MRKLCLSQKLVLYVASLCFSSLCLLFLQAPNANAAEFYASANRFLFTGTNVYGSSPQWSEPLRYNELVPIGWLYGLQVNTHPTVTPSGMYVTVRGKLNVSARNEGNTYPTFNRNALNNLTVQCSWGSVYLTTSGSSVMNNIGSGYYSPNSVVWDDLTFTWTGYFPNGYSGISSGDTLSCAVRPYVNGVYYSVPMISGSNYPQTYVYADNSSYDSYLSVETSTDQDVNALNEINNSLQNQTNIIIQGNNAIIDAINSQSENEKSEYEDQAQDVQDDLEDANAASVQQGATLISMLNQFFVAIRDATPANSCSIYLDMRRYNGGQRYSAALCQPKVKSFLQTSAVPGAASAGFTTSTSIWSILSTVVFSCLIIVLVYQVLNRIKKVYEEFRK